MGYNCIISFINIVTYYCLHGILQLTEYSLHNINERIKYNYKSFWTYRIDQTKKKKWYHNNNTSEEIKKW